MSEILLLFTSKRKDPKDANSPEEIAQQMVEYMNGLNKGGHYSYALYDDLVHSIDQDKANIIDSKSGRDLASFDVVYQRQYAMAPEEAVACAIYLETKQVPYIDSESNALGFWGKLSGYWRLWAAGLPIPRTFFVGERYVKEWTNHELEGSLGFPAIIKSNYGRRGRDNHLISSAAEAAKIVEASPQQSLIFQEFIPNKYGYRIWVCGQKIALVIERRPPEDSHLNNGPGSIGHEVPVSTLPAKLKADAIQAAKAVGREIAGIDVIIHEQSPEKYYFLEVNRSPQLFTRVTTPEKARAMDEYLRSLARRKPKTA